MTRRLAVARSLRWSGAALLAGLCLLLALAPTRAVAQVNVRRAIAIVVHPQSPVDGLSFSDLRTIFLGDRQFWPGGSRITLLVRAPVAYEREFVLDRIYRMSESQFRQYWIAKLFRAEVTTGPRILYSTDEVRDVVGKLPGAIGFMPASAVGPDVKVLRIDGKLPADQGYPLR